VAGLFSRDAQLHLPARGYSHRLQKRVAAKAAKMSFAEVVHDIAAETSVRMGKAPVEQIVYEAAQDFDAFYAQPCSTPMTPKRLGGSERRSSHSCRDRRGQSCETYVAARSLRA
jgi:hypothetical protein